MKIYPDYIPPDFSSAHLAHAPIAITKAAPADGIAPKNYHGTSNHPEYIYTSNGNWQIVPESRMDAVMVLKGETLTVVEARRVQKGDLVVVGRTENGEEGIYVHVEGFTPPTEDTGDKFSFRTGVPVKRPFRVVMTISTKSCATIVTMGI